MADKIVCPKCRHIQLRVYNNKNSNLITCTKCNYTWISLQHNKLREDGISVIMDSINHYNYTMQKANDPKFNFPFYALNNQFIKKNTNVKNEIPKSSYGLDNIYKNLDANQNNYNGYKPSVNNSSNTSADKPKNDDSSYKSLSSQRQIDEYKKNQIQNNKYISPQIKERILNSQSKFYVDNPNSYDPQQDSKTLREKILSKYSSIKKSPQDSNQIKSNESIENTNKNNNENNAQEYYNNYRPSNLYDKKEIENTDDNNQSNTIDEKIDFSDAPFFASKENDARNNVDPFDEYLNKIDQIKSTKTNINQTKNIESVENVKVLSLNESIPSNKVSDSQDLYSVIASQTKVFDDTKIEAPVLEQSKSFLDNNENNIEESHQEDTYKSTFSTRDLYKEEKLQEYKNIKESDFSVSADSIIDDISLLSIANRYNLNNLSNKIEEKVNNLSKKQSMNRNAINQNSMFVDESEIDIKDYRDQELVENKKSNKYNKKSIDLDIQDNLDDLTLGISSMIKAQSIPNSQYANIDKSSFFKDNNINQKYNYIDVLNELKKTFFSFNSRVIILKFFLYLILIIIILLGFTNFSYNHTSQYSLGKSDQPIIKKIPAIDNEDAIKKEQYYLENNTKEQNNLDSPFDIKSEDKIEKQDDLESKKVITLDKDLFLNQVTKHKQDSIENKPKDNNINQESFSMKGYLNKKLLDFNNFKDNLVRDIKIISVDGVWINNFSLKTFNVNIKMVNTSNELRHNVGRLEFVFVDSLGNTLDTKVVNIVQNIGIKETIVLKINFSDIPSSTKLVYAKIK